MDRTIPKKKTLDKWQNQCQWLKIENGKLVYSVCTKYKENLSRFLAATNVFMNDSNNCRKSALKAHSINKYMSKAL